MQAHAMKYRTGLTLRYQYVQSWVSLVVMLAIVIMFTVLRGGTDYYSWVALVLMHGWVGTVFVATNRIIRHLRILETQRSTPDETMELLHYAAFVVWVTGYFPILAYFAATGRVI